MPSKTRLVHQRYHKGAAEEHPVLELSAAHALARDLDTRCTSVLQRM